MEESPPVDMGYQRLLGKLIYLSHKRPDIGFVANVVSQFMTIQQMNRGCFSSIAVPKTVPWKETMFPQNYN